MNTPQDCRHELLATGPIARFDQCRKCGVISMHLGVTTLRLDPAACEALWATLSEALEQLHRREVAQPVAHGSLVVRSATRRGVA